MSGPWEPSTSSPRWRNRLHPDPPWDIRREGRAWGEEGLSRFELAPEKFEMTDGRLFWDEEDRLVCLALLLENVGVDTAVRLAPAAVWRAALDELESHS